MRREDAEAEGVPRLMPELLLQEQVETEDRRDRSDWRAASAGYGVRFAGLAEE